MGGMWAIYTYHTSLSCKSVMSKLLTLNIL